MVYEECLVAQWDDDEDEAPSRWKPSGPPWQSLEWVDPSFKGIRNGKKWVNHVPGVPNPSIRLDIFQGDMDNKPSVPVLLATCRQIHAEGAPILYGKNRFHLRPRAEACRTGNISNEGIFATYGPLVRNISVSLGYDYNFLMKVGSFLPLMTRVHRDILPVCSHLTCLEWTIMSPDDGWYSESFWKKWYPLWVEDREANMEARFQLLHDSLLELKPTDGKFLPFLQLNIDSNRFTWSNLEYHRKHRSRDTHGPHSAWLMEVKALKLELETAFKRTREADNTAQTANEPVGMLSTMTLSCL